MIWWLVSKIFGGLLIAAGVFLVIFFPGIIGHQEAGDRSAPKTSFGLAGIVIGLVSAIVGFFLLFSP